MAPLAEDDHLAPHGAHLLVGAHDALLQPRHYGAGGVDKLDAQPLRLAVGGRRLAVGTDEEALALETGHLLVGDGPQPQLLEALHLDAVVYDVAQRIDAAASGEGLLGLRDGPDHAEAEARFIVDFDVHLSSAFFCPLPEGLFPGSFREPRAFPAAVFRDGFPEPLPRSLRRCPLPCGSSVLWSFGSSVLWSFGP